MTRGEGRRHWPNLASGPVDAGCPSTGLSPGNLEVSAVNPRAIGLDGMGKPPLAVRPDGQGRASVSVKLITFHSSPSRSVMIRIFLRIGATCGGVIVRS
jgi:hypothetical protein